MTTSQSSTQGPSSSELFSKGSSIDTTSLKEEELNKIEVLKSGSAGSTGRRILFAYDQSENGNLAFKYTKTKLIQPGDHVFLVAILPTSVYQAEARTYVPDYNSETDRHTLTKMQDTAMGRLREKGKLLEAKGVDLTIHIAHEEPREAVIALADFHSVDLIILGRRRLGAFKKLMSSGSVSQHVLERANCLVLIVKNL